MQFLCQILLLTRKEPKMLWLLRLALSPGKPAQTIVLGSELLNSGFLLTSVHQMNEINKYQANVRLRTDTAFLKPKLSSQSPIASSTVISNYLKDHLWWKRNCIPRSGKWLTFVFKRNQATIYQKMCTTSLSKKKSYWTNLMSKIPVLRSKGFMPRILCAIWLP